ncbi:AraC family transcriptional regulator [Ferruginibacter paludis]|uniref:AraC family transcriptional regulator n=1 Tax=Ferruginibacter paludis TaxID=1310417 RepID=UPI0025B59FE0|nr:AraC family transcriptional regulator [Ferruginibacter paludis]MDN3655544.1 AraC family transcriptional regulator [Ferruginibacter paludis]
MKPTLRQITTTPEASFLVRKDVGESMLNNWHYHPEVELLYIKKSSGTWLIGDHIGNFDNGDMVLIGANLPHCFRHEYPHINKKGIAPGESICIKFVPDIFGSTFLQLPETKAIRQLLSKCNTGLKITGKAKNSLPLTIEKMLTATPGMKLAYLLFLLEEIATSKEYLPLSSAGFMLSAGDTNKDKIKLVFEYTFNRYNEKISLPQVAAILNMTTPSFCRYFKSKTNKTYIQFLMEVRIGFACRLLVEDEKNVSEVCYECGYNNLSHFNKQFKTITKKTPLGYRGDYLKMKMGS